MDPLSLTLSIVGIIISAIALIYSVVSNRGTAKHLGELQKNAELTVEMLSKTNALAEASQRPSHPAGGNTSNEQKEQFQQEQVEMARASGELMEQLAISQGAMGSMPGVFLVAQQKAKQAQCMSHLKQLGLAFMIYSQDHDEKLPDAEHWCDELDIYFNADKRILSCPTDGSSHSYAMNDNLSKVNLSKVSEPHRTVLLYDSDLRILNAHDKGESLPVPGRHLERNVILFADGHVEIADNNKIKSLKWAVT